MVLLGVGMYVPYVAVHTTIFERFIALTRERGNLGFLMYLADAIGYLGYVGVMLGRGLFPGREDFHAFFVMTASGLLLSALVLLLVSVAIYFKRLPKVSNEPAPAATDIPRIRGETQEKNRSASRC